MDWDDLKMPVAVLSASLLCLGGILFATTVDPVGLRLVIASLAIAVGVVPFWLAGRADTVVVPRRSRFDPAIFLVTGLLALAATVYSVAGRDSPMGGGAFFMMSVVCLLAWDLRRRRPMSK